VCAEFSTASRNLASGAVVHDKRHACYYCDMLVTNIGRHYQEIHSDEKEVTQLCQATNKKEKQIQLSKLRLLGDYHHNVKVIQMKRGLMILVRRPSHGHTPDVGDYLPCTHCLGFLHRKDLWRHVKHCPCRVEALEAHSFRRYQVESRLLVAPIVSGCSSASPALQSVLAIMKKDEIGLVARNDCLILSYGNVCAEKMARHEATYVSQKMRQLARLVMKLRELKGRADAQLSDFLSPALFDDVVSAVKLVCEFVPSDEQQLARLSTPSLALKLGHALQKCAAMLRNTALKAKDSDLASSAANYLLIHASEWPQKVSAFALRTISLDRQNNPEVLPLTGDIIKLSKYLDVELPKRTAAYEGECTAVNYEELVHVTLAKLITFNKRRSGETERIEVQQYARLPHVIGLANEEFSATLKPSERKLCERLHVLSITGKRGRTVPLLLTANLKKAMDVIANAEMRAAVGVSPSNVYVFARACISSLHSFRGSDCLKKCAVAAECEQPETVTSKYMRKYISTVSQVMALTPNELEWLTGHLGHNTDVHKLFYRMHISTIELAKVSKLLIAVDEGKAHEFAGKSMEDIDIDDNLPMQKSDDLKPSSEVISHTDVEPSDSSSGEEDHQVDQVRGRKRMISDSDSDVEGIPRKKTRKSVKKIPWSADEKEAVLKALSMHLKKGTVPGKKECEEVKTNSGGLLANRTWFQIKYCVKNAITASRRMANRPK